MRRIVQNLAKEQQRKLIKYPIINFKKIDVAKQCKRTDCFLSRKINDA